MKLQPGDYVSTEGMTEEEYHSVRKALIDNGADASGNAYGYIFPIIGWDSRDNSLYETRRTEAALVNAGRFKRKLTKDQILGAQKMDIKEAYKLMQDNCGIEVGDTVKVLRTAKRGEFGWPATWVDSMSEAVGESFKVIKIRTEGANYGLKLDNGYIYPFFSLELVKKGKKLPEPIEVSSIYKATFNEDGSINVGCQRIDFDTIEKIYHAAKGVIGND